jgi:hypothetical protein
MNGSDYPGTTLVEILYEDGVHDDLLYVTHPEPLRALAAARKECLAAGCPGGFPVIYMGGTRRMAARQWVGFTWGATRGPDMVVDVKTLDAMIARGDVVSAP